jgi:hypothetical protein
MSVIFSYDFDAGQTTFNSDWTNSGVTLSTGGVVPSGYCVACSAGTAYHGFTPTATISLRAQEAIILPPATSASLEQLFIGVAHSGTPNFYAYYLGSDNLGRFYIRWNNVLSPVYSSAGVAPIDGTWYAVQWRLSQLTSTTVSVAVDVNNTTVWTTTWDQDSLGFLGADTSNTFSTLFIHPNQLTIANQLSATDKIEVDNSNAKITWSLASSNTMTQLLTPSPTLAVTGMAVTGGGSTLTLTGTFRPPVLAYVQLDGVYTAFTVVSASTTTIVLTFSPAIATTNVCAKVYSQLCWETTAVPPPTTFCTTAPPVTVTYPTVRERVFVLPFETNLMLFLNRIEFLVQAGEGLVTGQGSDPTMEVRFSRDGGKTYGNAFLVKPGKIGEYDTRSYINRLGRARNWVCKVRVSDPVFWALLDCYADMEEGTS